MQCRRLGIQGRLHGSSPVNLPPSSPLALLRDLLLRGSAFELSFVCPTFALSRGAHCSEALSAAAPCWVARPNAVPSATQRAHMEPPAMSWGSEDSASGPPLESRPSATHGAQPRFPPS